MKKISAIRNIPYLTIILLTLICILLLSSKNMIMSQASYPEATIVSSAYAVVEGSDSDKEEITFPHTFKHLSPRTHVTVTTHINLNKDDPISFWILLTHGRHVVYRRVQLHRCHSQKPYTAVSVCFYRAFLADDSAAVFLQACSWF